MKIAYITLATTERYLEGSRLLYHSYLKTNSKYPFFIITSNNLDLKNFEDLPLIKINFFSSNNKLTKQPVDFFYKIYMYSLIDYDYVLFLDADCLLTENIDHSVEQVINENQKRLIFFTKNYIKTPYSNITAISSERFIAKPNLKDFLELYKLSQIKYNDEQTLFEHFINFKDGIGDCLNEHLYKNINHIPGIPGKKYWEIQIKDAPDYFIEHYNKIFDIINSAYKEAKENNYEY